MAGRRTRSAPQSDDRVGLEDGGQYERYRDEQRA
jgi:hypothetical protein